MTSFLPRDDNILPKKELHWSPWVEPTAVGLRFRSSGLDRLRLGLEDMGQSCHASPKKRHTIPCSCFNTLFWSLGSGVAQ